MSSIKELVRAIIFEHVVDSVKPESGWKTLMADRPALRILSSCCSLPEVIDHGVTIVDDIAKSRMPFPDQDAIYLIAPTAANVALILKDFVDPAGRVPPKYKCAHIFFTEAAPDAIVQQLAPLNTFIVTLKELPLAFVPNEARVFSLDSPRALFQLYSIGSKDDGLARTAQQVAAVCSVLAENPAVRYMSESPQAARLAQLVQGRIDEQASAIAAGAGAGKRPKGTLLIMDRSYDGLTPLLHSLTYQAAAYDLCQLPNDVYKFDYTNGAGRKSQREVLMSEQDPLWVKFRHAHVAEVFKGVGESFSAFVAEKKQAGPKKKGDEAFGHAQLRQMMKDLPQHSQDMAKFSLHVSLSADIQAAFDKRTEMCTLIEQNLALGYRCEGDKRVQISNFVDEISDVLVDGKVSVDNKLRVLALCVIVAGGIDPVDLPRFMDTAAIPPAKRAAVYNLARLGVSVENKRGRPLKLDRPKGTQSDVELVLSRWVPLLTDVVRAVAQGSLSIKDYPVIRGDVPPSVSGKMAASPKGGKKKAAAAAADDDDDDDETVVSARKKGLKLKEAKMAATGAGPASGAAAAAAAEASSAAPRQRLVIFVLGAVSYAEMKVAYDLSQQYPLLDVFVGSHVLATPRHYLQLLADLSQPRVESTAPVLGLGDAVQRMELSLATEGVTV